MYSLAQVKAIVFIPVGTGSLSFVASATLIIMILFFSRIKLSAAVRRILFGMCVYDIFFSIASAVSTLAVPVGQGLYGSSGTVATCDAQGFFMHIGSIGALLYNSSLSIYYVSVIKFNMTEPTFKKKVEFWCHFIPNAYAWGSAIFLLATNNFNSVGNMCWITASPPECIINSDIDCVRGNKMAASYRNWFALYVFPVGCVLVIVNMCLIIHTVLMQKIKGDKWRFGRSSSSGTSSNNADNFPRLSRCVTWLFERCKNVRMCVCCLCRGCGDRAGENQIQTTKTASNRPAANGDGDGGGDIEALPSLKTCLEPVEVLKVPTTSCPYYDRSKGAPAGNGPSRAGKSSNVARVPKSAYVTEAGSSGTGKPTASASRSGTKKDQYAFNLGKVRASIRRESLVALQSEEDISKVKAAASAPATATATASIALDPNIDNDDPIAGGKRLSTISSKRQSTVSFTNSANDASVFAEEDPPPRNANSNSSNERRAEDEAIAQALLYIAAFIISWIFPMIGRTMELQGKEIPFFVILLARIFTPAQGVFTILVYTRPHVRSIRKNNPEYSWFKAFGIAFKAGGDNDSVGQAQGGGRRRSNSLRPISAAEKKKKQDRITKDFQRRMAEIERRKTVSANYDPAAARAIREAGEQMELEVAAEDESQEQDEDEDIYRASQSKDDDIGSCRLSESETWTDGLIFDEELGAE